MKHILLLVVVAGFISSTLFAQNSWQMLPNQTSEKITDISPHYYNNPFTITATKIINKKTCRNDTTFFLQHTIVTSRIYSNESITTTIKEILSPIGADHNKVLLTPIEVYSISTTVNGKNPVISTEKNTQSVDIIYSHKGNTTKDTVLYPISKPTSILYMPSSIRTSTKKDLIDVSGSDTITIENTSIIHTALTNRKLRKIYEQAKLTKDPNCVYFGINFMPSFAARKLVINDKQFPYNNELNTRNQTERANFGWAKSIAVGITLHKAHTLFGEYLFLQQGFRSENTSINWHTGLVTVAPNKINQLRFISQGFGIGYNYSPYQRLINPTFESGMYFTWLNDFKDNGVSMVLDQRNSIGLIQHNIGFNIGFGITIRPRYWSEFKIMPTFFYNFSDINSGDLKTKLYNTGITVGYVFRFIHW